MGKHALSGLVAALVAVAVTLPVAAAEPAGVDAATAFDRYKALAGSWDITSEQASGTVTYRVVSAGSVVMETLFGGTEHEMITMYHRDGDELVATHYCAAGNQPRFTLDRATATADRYHLAFAGGSNMKPGDGHIHEGRFHFVDSDHVEVEWVHWQGGQAAGGITFTMVRRAGAAPPAAG